MSGARLRETFSSGADVREPPAIAVRHLHSRVPSRGCDHTCTNHGEPHVRLGLLGVTRRLTNDPQSGAHGGHVAPPALDQGSRVTACGLLSSCSPAKLACRRLPPVVHSVNATSITTRGFSRRSVSMSSAVMPSPQWLLPVLFGRLTKGYFDTCDSSMRLHTSRRVVSVNPARTFPAK